jgi:hypothetical protein
VRQRRAARPGTDRVSPAARGTVEKYLRERIWTQPDFQEP